MRQREINIGKACNNDCVFCSNGVVPRAERRWVPFHVIVEEIQRAAAEGFDALGFLGGEPTLRKDLVEIVRTAKTAGFDRIALCTNGRRLRDKGLLDALLDAGVTRITLSIHSHRSHLEDQLCQRPGAFFQKMCAIDNIVESHNHLRHGFALNTVLHARNVGDLPELAAFFAERGVTEIRFNLIRPEHLVVGDASWIPRLSVVSRSIARTVRWVLGHGLVDVSFSDVPLCGYPQEILSVEDLLRTVVGEWRDLETSVVVHRVEGRDQFDWKTRRTGRLKAKTHRCAACGLRDVCEGVWVRFLELHGDQDIRPISRELAGSIRSLLKGLGEAHD